MSFQLAELDFIRSLHLFRTPALDAFFKTLNFFDRGPFFVLLVMLFWLFAKKSRLQFVYILFFNMTLNKTLKALFAMPRPSVLDPSLSLVSVGGFSFPSGAAQFSIVLSGIILTTWGSFLRWPLAILYTLLISFSRIYIGAHFPSDILVGWIVGFGVITLYLKGFPWIEEKLKTLTPLSLFFLRQAVFLVLWWFFQENRNYSPLLIGAMGLHLGLFVNEIFHKESFHPRNLLEVLLAFTVVGGGSAFFLLLPGAFALKMFLVTFWMVTPSAVILHKIRLRGKLLRG